MGTGKSAIATYLGENFNMSIVEMDETIEERQQKKISEIFQDEGEEYFRNLETDLLKEIAGNGNAVVSCGGGTPLREENISIMKENGKVVLLSAKPETIFQRVRYSHNRPLLENNMNVEYIAQLLEKRIDKYERAADFVVVTDDRSKQEIAEEIISKINK